jgi:PKHD-type hydroxylase
MIYHWWLDRKINNGYAYANNIFSSEELDSITKIGLDQSLSSVEKPLVGQNSDSGYRICETSFIRSDIDSNQWIFMKLTDVITEINKQYFNFDLDYIQNLQFTSYSVGGHYGRHTDLANAAERPRKLSFVLQLSDMDEYDEGELKIYYSDEPYIAQKTKGTLTVFPSYALHEVVPITKGTRYSLVGWVCGPCFK